ncbi:DUF6049 family protein [Nocardioides hungaricus]
MLRPVSLLSALVVAAACLAGFAAPVHAAAPQRAAEDTPLTVTIDSLSPTAIPRKGPIRVSGTVTNRDDQTWTSVNLYAFLDTTPMTTPQEIADQAEVAPEEYVGARILEPGTYATVDELAAGATARYSLIVPRSVVRARVSEPGVYWFGVHAIGFDESGTDDGLADGRARTFMPLIPARTQKTVDTALVIPIRRRIAHAPDGSIADVRRWTRSLRGGALSSLVDLGATAGGRPVTWLVDPAVVDAVRRLADGNPPRSLAPTITQGGEGGETESPSPSPTEDAEGQDEGRAEPDPRTAAAAAAATDWLDRLRRALPGNEILTLPYGDLDVAAAAEHDPRAYREARKRSSGDLAPWDLPTTPAVAAPSGYLDAAGIRQTEPGTTTIVTDQMFGRGAPAIATTAGRTLVVSSSGAASGGPGPDDPLSPIAVRQRIASEAAVRLLAPDQPPLFVVLPSTWSPPADSDFFAGLDDLDWIDLTTVDGASSRPGTAVPAGDLDYPEEQDQLELDATSFAAAQDLVGAGETLQNLLTLNDQVAAEVRDEAFTDLSYATRGNPAEASAGASASTGWITSRLRSVGIDAPKAVILSSGSGGFAATVTNGLDQPVSVRIRAIAEPPLKVSVPAETIELSPESQSTVLLNASSTAVGIRNLRLLLTDSDDVPLGSSDDLPIRSNRVSNVIWLIVGTGIALLFGAIAVRLFRRVRTARRGS